ncbi:hypothetical protein NDU88_005506 [Pleurodeles waltl]|uniref:Uncharacterized protein n=1 Tax=Pleurodeles waltl TaxID=8319 RepID=A0AAV7QJ82_PLEWA|nr:hypothetical protein NDU88_005506 [Pleurodeles waltl]
MTLVGRDGGYSKGEIHALQTTRDGGYLRVVAGSGESRRQEDVRKGPLHNGTLSRGALCLPARGLGQGWAPTRTPSPAQEGAANGL